MCSIFFFFFFWEEAKCVVDFSQSIKNIKRVDKSKRIHDIIVYTCQYIFFLYHGITSLCQATEKFINLILMFSKRFL